MFDIFAGPLQNYYILQMKPLESLSFKTIN